MSPRNFAAVLGFAGLCLLAVAVSSPAAVHAAQYIGKGTHDPAPVTFVETPVITEDVAIAEGHPLFRRSARQHQQQQHDGGEHDMPSDQDLGRHHEDDAASERRNDTRFRMPLPRPESHEHLRTYARQRVQQGSPVEEHVVTGYDCEKGQNIESAVDWSIVDDEFALDENVEAQSFYDVLVNRRRATCFVNSPPSGGCSAESLVFQASEIRPFTVKIIFTTPYGLNMCSGTMFLEDRFVLTASHCVYDTENSAFYTNIKVVPAMEDRTFPYSDLTVNDYDGMDRPFGTANVVAVHTYPGYTTGGAQTSDQTLLVLDRPLGRRTGVIMASTSQHPYVNNNGYPGENPHSGHLMYNRYAPINFQSCDGTDQIFRSDHDAYGGDSGSGTFVVLGGVKYLFGNLYSGPRPCPNYYVRLTDTKLSYWRDVMTNYGTVTDRPQIIEYVNLSGATKGLSVEAAVSGDTVEVTFSLYNVGFASGTATVQLAIDTDATVTGSETALGSAFTVTLNAGSYTTVTRTITLTGVTANTFNYVKAIWTTSPSQYDDYQNYVIVGRFLATSEPCARHATCDECTADPACGFCGNTFCWRGDSSGASGATCSTWSFSTCTDACSQYSKCSTCTQYNGCGWCGTSGECTSGRRQGALEGECGDWDWYDVHCNAPLDPSAPPHSTSTTDSAAVTALASFTATLVSVLIAMMALLWSRNH